MAMYIKGMGAISPQKTWDDDSLLSQATGYNRNRLTCIEPDYAHWIDAKSIRRMSRIVKMGVASAFMALKNAGISTADGIITGTGLGCLEDTGIFLTKMIELREQALNPTPFIQSTHNTIGSQIALLLQCQQYSQTYTHNAFSFESALLDGFMHLSDNPNQQLLIGGVDEITEISHIIHSRYNIYRKKLRNSLDLFKSVEKGTLQGEGATYFAVSGNKGEHDIASIEAITTLYKPEAKELRTGIQSFLAASSIRATDIGMVLIGKSGDKNHDFETGNLIDELFPTSSVGLFKHLCGEYSVASAFGTWLGAKILHNHHIPDIVVYKDSGRTLQNILLYNPYFGTHHSLILLKSCRDTL